MFADWPLPPEPKSPNWLISLVEPRQESEPRVHVHKLVHKRVHEPVHGSRLQDSLEPVFGGCPMAGVAHTPYLEKRPSGFFFRRRLPTARLEISNPGQSSAIWLSLRTDVLSKGRGDRPTAVAAGLAARSTGVTRDRASIVRLSPSAFTEVMQGWQRQPRSLFVKSCHAWFYEQTERLSGARGRRGSFSYL